jgi:hypothetical protein
MKLREFEITAITNKVHEELTKNLKIPSFDKEIKKEKEYYDIIDKSIYKINKEKDKIKEIQNNSEKYVLSVLTTHIKDFNKDALNTRFKNKFISDNIPRLSKIKESVILSNNSNLSELVDELVKKYS